MDCFLSSKYVNIIMKRLSSWRRLFLFRYFIKRLQKHGHEFRDETKLLAKETLYNSARFLLVVILIHGNDKHAQLVLNELREFRVLVNDSSRFASFYHVRLPRLLQSCQAGKNFKEILSSIS